MVRSRVVAWFCAVLVVYVSSSENSWHNGTEYKGRLSPGCIEKYHRTYVQNSVPRRNYRYFHEYQEYSKSMREEGFVPLQWRIVGGQQVDITQAPYAVLYGPYCGGSLISPEWVITAAHCKSRDNYVVSGSTKISEGVHYPICAHFIHPWWENPEKPHFHDYDYQLLLLEKPVPITPRSRPIAIGSMNDVRAGAMLSISGWGHSQSNQKQMLDSLRQVSVPIIPREECKNIPHKYYTSITLRMFCAGLYNGTKDSCQGDSGGPAVSNSKLIGLVSFGVGCALKERPGVYAIVPFVRPWIREVTGLPL